MIDVEQMADDELRVVQNALRRESRYPENGGQVTRGDELIAERLANLVWAEHCRRVGARMAVES